MYNSKNGSKQFQFSWKQLIVARQIYKHSLDESTNIRSTNLRIVEQFEILILLSESFQFAKFCYESFAG